MTQTAVQLVRQMLPCLALALACRRVDVERASAARSALDSTDLVVAGLSQGMDSAAVLRLLGRPDSMSATRDPRDPPAKIVEWHYPRLIVALGSYNSVGGVALTGPGTSTKRGLQVGDSRARLVELYGIAADTTGDTWEYATKDGTYVMQVNLDAGRVRQIFLGHLYD